MARNKPPELLPGTLDLMILKTLAVGPNHGYGIARRIKQTSGDVLHVEEGSLYPALHRLAKRGCLDSEWRSSESNRRAKYYRLVESASEGLPAYAQRSDEAQGTDPQLVAAHHRHR